MAAVLAVEGASSVGALHVDVWGAANNITATFACRRHSLLSRCGSAAPCLLAPFSERGELVPTAGIPARCARHLAAGHAQPCSEVCVVCGTCASHPAAPAEQGVPTAPLHRLLTWPCPLRQSREQILTPLLKLRARRRLSKTSEPNDPNRGRRRSTST